MKPVAAAQITIASVSDGTGIASIEVKYAASASGTTPPADDGTTTSEQPLTTDGETLLEWGATGVVTLAVGGVWQDEPPLPLTDDEPYLWVRTIITYTDGTQSEPSYTVSYKGRDGTDGNDGSSVTVKGEAYAHVTTALNLPKSAPSGQIYLVDGQLLAVYTAAYKDDLATSTSTFQWKTAAAATGDTWRTSSDGHLWTYAALAWTDLGKIDGDDGAKGDQGDKGDKGDKGDTGAKGDDGEDAWTLAMTASAFAVDEDALTLTSTTAYTVASNASTALIRVSLLHGSTVVEPKGTVTGVSYCAAAASTYRNEVYVTLKTLSAQTVTKQVTVAGVTTSKQLTMPVANAYVTLTVEATHGDSSFSKQLTLPVAVTFSQTFATLTATSEGVTAALTTLKTEQQQTTEDVAALQIEQRHISLFVDSAIVKGANLVRASLQRALFSYYRLPLPHAAMLTKGKQYTLQAWGWASGDGVALRVYAYTSGWTDNALVEISESALATASKTFTAAETGLYTIAAYRYPSSATGYAFCERVQLIEGDTAAPWSLAQDDPDANAALIDGQDMTALGGSLLADGASGQYADDDGQQLPTWHVNAASGAATLLTASAKLSGSSTYTLSLWARGTGTLTVRLLSGTAVGAVGSDGQQQTGNVATMLFTLSTEWRRIWMTLTTAETLSGSKTLSLLVAKGAEAWVSGVKLERGGRATQYGVDGRLLATGIDIRQRKITVTADQFTIQNNSGQPTATVNKDGVLECSDIVCNGGTFHGTVRAADYLIDTHTEYISYTAADTGTASVDGDSEDTGVSVATVEGMTYHTFTLSPASNSTTPDISFARCYIPYPSAGREGQVVDVFLSSHAVKLSSQWVIGAWLFILECTEADSANGWEAHEGEQTAACFVGTSSTGQDQGRRIWYAASDSATERQRPRRLHARLACVKGAGGAYQWAVLDMRFQVEEWLEN